MARVSDAKIVAAGGLQLPAGAAAGKLAQSDASGNVSWASASGAPDWDDDFSASRLGSYTADQATSLSGLVVSGGRLTSTDTHDHSWHHSTVSVIDAKHIVKVVPGTTTAYVVYLLMKYIDDNNFLMFEVLNGSTSASLYQCVAGAYTSLATPNSPLAANGDPAWFVCRQSGNGVRTEIWTTNPLLGGVPYSAASITMSGTAKTALGAGVAGKPGLRLAGYAGGITSTDWALDDWTVVSLATAARGGF